MLKSLVLGTILGGLAAFLWSMISWEVIGWHEKTMVSFQSEDEVSAVIAAHAPVDGTYMLPGRPKTEGMTVEQKKNAEAATIEKMQKGPIMVAGVRRKFGSIAKAFIVQILSLMAAAFLLTWMLMQTSGSSYARRAAFLAVAGLAASVIVDLPNWNWWGFSGAYTAVNLADSTITWLVAGLVIAKVAKPGAS